MTPTSPPPLPQADTKANSMCKKKMKKKCGTKRSSYHQDADIYTGAYANGHRPTDNKPGKTEPLDESENVNMAAELERTPMHEENKLLCGITTPYFDAEQT